MNGKQMEKWESVSTFPINQDPNQHKKANCTVNLTDKSYLLKYDSNDKEYSWDEVSPITMTPNVTIVKDDMQSMNNITQHYIRLLSQDGTIECTWKQKEKGNNNQQHPKINEDNSTYTLIYDGGGAILTYLHITSNELNVTLD
jgi:hypothetical protein